MSLRRKVEYGLASRVVGPTLAKADRTRTWWKRRNKPWDPNKPMGPPPDTLSLLKEVSLVHYFKGRYADGAVPVAWVTSGAPIEVLRPLGYYLAYPENHGAICGAGHSSPQFIEAAEEAGFSQDICSYARTDFGALITGETPIGRIPLPDLLVCCTNICQTVLYWYRELARRLDVPLVIIDTPQVYGELPAAHREYVIGQLRHLADVASRVARKKWDEDAFGQAVLLSRDGCQLWADCMATNTAYPAPWTAFDQFVHMIPIVTMRGTTECLDYYRVLHADLQDRIQRGIGGVANEKIRIVWDNLPIWYRMKDMGNLLAESGVAMVAATYTDAWATPALNLDSDDPWDGVARAYTQVILNRDQRYKIELMRSMAKKYDCLGVLFHSDRSCKPYSVGQVELRDQLAADGLKALMLEADHNDPRAFADQQAETRIGAFIETFGGGAA